MKEPKTKSQNSNSQKSVTPSVLRFFTIFRNLNKEKDADHLMSLHNDVIPRVFRRGLIFGAVLFVVGFVISAYQEVDRTVPDKNPVLSQLQMSKSGGLVAILSSPDSLENKLLRLSPQSEVWSQVALTKEEVFDHWLSVSPDTEEMFKMESDELGDVTFSYYDGSISGWREVDKFNDGPPQEAGLNFFNTQLKYEFQFDWGVRFGFYGLNDFALSQKRRYLFKEDNSSQYQYSKFRLDRRGVMVDVKGLYQLEESQPRRIVDGFLISENANNTFWKYSFVDDAESARASAGSNRQFTYVPTLNAAYAFGGGAVIRKEYGENSSDLFFSLPNAAFGQEQVVLVEDDSLGNLLIAFGSGIIYSGDLGRSWENVSLPDDSLSVKEMVFDWETQTGAMIAYKKGFDRVYTWNERTNIWTQVPLFIEASSLPFQKVLTAFWAVGYLDILLLLFLFIRTRQISDRVAKLTDEPTPTPLSLRSDNPVDEDTLGIFTSSQKALAKLIANESTQPPVSIAINGGWGSGKSSLMKMLRKDLREKGNGNYVTIWFNVWHFESEEHLLAVFLAKMVERFNEDLGTSFRIRLFANRIRKLSFNPKFRFFFFLFMITPLIIYFLNALLFRPATFDLYGIPFFKNLFEGVRAFVEQGMKVSNWSSNLWLPVTGGLLLVALLTGLFNLSKTWTPTGFSALMQLFPVDELKKESHDKNPGYRDKYKKEFWRLLESVGKDTKIVIFIDDLDRVTGSKIKQLLEGINFISDTASTPDDVDDDTANMYFIIGMALKEVVKNLEGELIRDDKFTTEGEKVSLGLRFIEKMIDLTVQIPPISRAKTDKLQSLVSMEDG